MIAAEIEIWVAVVAAAFFSAVLLITVLVAVAHVELRLRASVFSAVIPGLLLGIALSTIQSGRNLTLASFDPAAIVGYEGGRGLWSLRFVTLGVLASSAAALMRSAWHARTPRLERSALLMAAFGVHWLASNVLSAAIGSGGGFSHQLGYPLLVFMAAFSQREVPLEKFVRPVSASLVVFCIGSLVAAIVAPSLAIQPEYRGWIPGLGYRFWGLGSNANSIGPLALLTLLLQWLYPARRRWLRWLAVGTAAAVLVLAQSKTAWGATIVATIVLWLHRRRRPSSSSHELVTVALLAVAAIVVALWVLEPWDTWARFSSTAAGADVQTLTGRDRIWAVAVKVWLSEPWIGYGPEAWGPAFRASFGLPFAFSAHNQALQTLSSAGLLGLVTLTLYLGALGGACWKVRHATRGVSLSIGVIMNGDFVAHLVLFSIALRAWVPGDRPVGRGTIPLSVTNPFAHVRSA